MSRPIILTRTGSTSVSTEQSQFGGASARFFGNGLLAANPGNYLNFGTGAFTVEFWMRPQSLPTSGSAFIIDHEYPNIVSWVIQLQSGGDLQLFGGTGGSPQFLIGAPSGTITANTWHHVAITRSGTTLRMFVNGVQQASTTNSMNFQVNANDIYNIVFGGARFGAAYYSGWLDEIRISNVARYTANFTVPTQEFVNDEETLLLIHANGANNSTTFTDDVFTPLPSVPKQLFVWGQNADGRLGLGNTTNPVTTPTALGDVAEWKTAATGSSHSLGIKSNGTLWGWGSNASGKTGVGLTTGNTLTPTQIGTDSNWVQVTAGVSASLAINGLGELYSWGGNGSGITGQNTTGGELLSPTRVGTASNWAFVTATPSNAYALTTTGELWAWGNNISSGLGFDSGNTSIPTRVGTASNWIKLSGGSDCAAAINSSGELWVWGLNSGYQLGLGDTTTRLTPTKLGSADNWVNISIASHALAINNIGELYTWGFNASGRTGLGVTTGSTETPTRIGTASNWTDVGTQSQSSFAVNNQGSLFAWGFNGGGQLGLGNTTSPITTPLLVSESENNLNWSEINTKFNHSLSFKEVIPVTASADLFSAFDANISAGKRISQEVQLSSVSLLDISVNKIINFNSSLSSISSSTVTGNVIVDTSVNLESNTQVDINIEKIISTQALLSSTAVLSVETRVIIPEDQFYFEDGYIEDGYFVAIFEGDIALFATTTKNIILSQIQNFEATLVAEVLVDSQVNKIADFISNLTAEFSQAAMISHIQGADLFAFSEAQLAALVQRIRDNNIDLESVFDVGVDYTRIIQGLIDADSDFDLNIDSLRQRDAASVLEAAFSIDIDADVIPPIIISLESTASLSVFVDNFVEFDADLTSDATLDAVIGVIQQRQADLFSEFDLTAFGFTDKEVVLQVSVNSILDVDAEKIVDVAADFESIATKLAAAVKIVNKDIDFVAFTDIDVVAEKSVDASATLSADFDIAIDIEVIKNTDADLQSLFDLNIQVLKIVDINVDLTSSAELSALAGTLLDSGLIAFESISSKLTVGRLVNLDMKVYVIPQETRQYIIAAETRNHRIGAETRIHSIRSTR